MADESDLLVIGAGSAGAVIAARVSEVASRSVTVIEAGPDYAADDLPADLRDGRHNSMRAHDWGYRMRANERMPVPFDFPRGKVVGGSSAVNTCIALRSPAADYDEWAAMGLPQWSFAACLPAFRRLERDLDFGGEPWHGKDGPLPIRRFQPHELVPWQAAFVRAAEDAGYPACKDSNAPGAIGVGPHAMNVIAGERMSVARCYLDHTVRARDNFTLLANTMSRRLIIERGRCVGVEVQTRGDVRVLRARSTVLSAGAIGTPALLLRSGIGPKASVARLAVPLVREVPGVAERMLEHPGAALFFRPRRGVLRLSDPLIQTVLLLGDMLIQPGSRAPLPQLNLPLVTIAGHVGKPRRAGRIVFESADPLARPSIFAHALEDAEDRRRLRLALQEGVRLTERAPMAALATPIFPSRRVLADEDAFDTWLRRWSGTGYHPCGTVPMGADDDAHAATDGYGRVRGIAGLYVADASLMPSIPMANINLSTIMIGERFGEWFSSGLLG